MSAPLIKSGSKQQHLHKNTDTYEWSLVEYILTARSDIKQNIITVEGFLTNWLCLKTVRGSLVVSFLVILPL